MDNQGTLSERYSGEAPGILLVATNRWPLAARLASGFLDLGCRVAAVCPVPGHPIRKVRGFNHIYRYDGRQPLESLGAAIEAFAPDIIIPLCDRSVQHLHGLYTSCNAETEAARRVRKLIEGSLGPPTSYPIVSSRFDLLMLAKDAGIRIPETVRVDSVQDLAELEKEPPWLLKADGTWGGRGVRKADDLASAKEALQELTTRASVLGLAKQLVLNRDRDWTVANWRRSRPRVIAQAFVAGRPANCAICCWQGEVLAGIAVEVIRADGPCQPATIVQIVEGREMIDAAKQIARRLRLSGFFGLDFIIEHKTGERFLIEMNPRCTPPCSVSLGEGRDLVSAIRGKLTNQNVHDRPSLTDKTKIAYFPQVQVDGLDSVCLDIPNEQPELIHELLHPWSERSLAGRLLDWLSGKSVAANLTPCVFEIPKLSIVDAGKRDPIQQLELQQEQVITEGAGEQVSGVESVPNILAISANTAK
jgi:hypothetical protein